MLLRRAPSPQPTDHTTAPPIDALVLQGGGCRCFFTLGFLQAAQSALPDVQQIAAVSASCAMGLAHLLDRHDWAFREFSTRVRNNPRNFYPERLLSRQNPMPHYAMYREALLAALPPSAVLQIQQHPTRLRMAVSRSPTKNKPLTTFLGALAILRKRRSPLLQLGVLEAGLQPTAEAMADAVLASSAFPPFTPTPIIDGALVIDGGAVAAIPHTVLEAGAVRTPLFVLTRPHPVWPLPSGSMYVAPPVDLGVSTWQYASEPLLRVGYEHGLRAGEAFAKTRAVLCVR